MMGCFHVSPSPAAFSVAQQPAAVAGFRQVVGRRAHCLHSPSPPRLSLRLTETRRPRLAIRAHNPHYNSGENTRCFCGLADNAVTMASHVVDSASLNPTTPSEISRETVHRTLGVYVQIFVQTADDTFNNTVSKETITSFLGALRGVASVAHILLQAALEGLSQEHPKESLSEYAFNYDVKKMYHVYDRRMRELEDGIRNAPTEIHTCKILMPTICEGMEATESFVALMMARRKRTLEKIQSKVVE
ncbi:hypothetical protein BDA96_02G430400 [Sorghum bicolor]|uniref:Uncharacterized protein n=1 Tax=Sorghum bicolor TaxID=4558 RepID=A0A921RU71_SORBI|nr:hypothetical protein BDA96_02G430400 [Sorghum bicolor]